MWFSTNSIKPHLVQVRLCLYGLLKKFGIVPLTFIGFLLCWYSVFGQPSSKAD